MRVGGTVIVGAGDRRSEGTTAVYDYRRKI